MKISTQSFKTNQASTLLAVALLAVIVGGALASYLLIVKDETMRGFRSQTWNTSLMVAEAGVEDALALVNKYEATSTPLTNWITTAVTQDNWNTPVTISPGVQVYQMTRTLGSGANYVGTYTVYVTNILTTTTNGTIWIPTILSIGTVSNTFGPAAVRKVLVQTTPDVTKYGGLISETPVTLGGNNIVDSYDSGDPTYSFWHTNWFYQGRNYGTYTNTLRSADAVVGTLSGLITMNGNNWVYGYVDTGPGGADVLKGNGNSVGDTSWVPTTGIQPGHARDDMNVTFNDAVLPIATNSYHPLIPTWYSPGYYSSGTNIGTPAITYYYVITNVPGQPSSPTNKIFWSLDSGIIPNNKASIFIDASNAVLYLPTGISLKSANGLTLNTNGNVEIYSAGTFDTGNGAVNNYYQYAPPFTIYGLPTCTSIVFPGNASLTARVYAPEAAVTFSGGGSNPYDVAGAFVANSITLSGHFHFHFDTQLKTNGPPYRFVADNWQEVH